MKILPWLDRFPVGLFAIPVGLFALAGAWHRAEKFGWPLAAPTAQALSWSALALLAVLSMLYAAKCLQHPRTIATEFGHPLTSSMMALVPVSFLLCTITFGKADHAGWLSLTLLALALQAFIAIHITGRLTTASFPTEAITPALYVPPVGGGLVGGMALSALGYPGWAALLFGMGLVSWGLLEIRVLNRLFDGTMPASLRPTVGLELAPATISTLAAASLWPMLPGDVLIVGLGIAAGPVVAVLTRWNWWARIPFALGFWSFSFPLAAFSGAVIEVVQRGSWPPLVGGLALFIATSAIAFLLFKTTLLLLSHRLLLPVAAPQT